MAEGGTGKSLEYFKTQAIIARTYMYKYFNKHIADKYNVCDNTDCRVQTGYLQIVFLTRQLWNKGIVILNKDSTLIVVLFIQIAGEKLHLSAMSWISRVASTVYQNLLMLSIAYWRV